ncbi:MAG: antibiotic biosynthesis monooxygenase [Oceanospirillaceae bacterium]
MSKNIYWTFSAAVNEGSLEQVKELASTMIELTQQEAGAIAYEWSLSPDESILYVYERYQNSDAALQHLANVGSCLPKLMQLISPIKLDCYGSVSESFKEAVKGLPMVYNQTFNGFHK